MCSLIDSHFLFLKISANIDIDTSDNPTTARAVNTSAGNMRSGDRSTVDAANKTDSDLVNKASSKGDGNRSSKDGDKAVSKDDGQTTSKDGGQGSSKDGDKAISKDDGQTTSKDDENAISKDDGQPSNTISLIPIKTKPIRLSSASIATIRNYLDALDTDHEDNYKVNTNEDGVTRTAEGAAKIGVGSNDDDKTNEQQRYKALKHHKVMG